MPEVAHPLTNRLWSLALHRIDPSLLPSSTEPPTSLFSHAWIFPSGKKRTNRHTHVWKRPRKGA
jgi:hypothetical protein